MDYLYHFDSSSQQSRYEQNKLRKEMRCLLPGDSGDKAGYKCN